MASTSRVYEGDPINLNRLIRAIEEREGATWRSPGGRLQFTKATWEQYSRLPYARACDPLTARSVAYRMMVEAINHLLERNIKPTPEWLARRWNLGLAGMYDPTKRCDYAVHVSNLYYKTE